MSPHLYPKHYDSDVGAQAKPSTTGAEYRIAFTLAEVLITLSIIGVVAALTIPSLISKNQEKETVVRLKKAYNVFANAFLYAQAEYGNIDSLGLQGKSILGSSELLDYFAPFLNIVTRCDGMPGCFPNVIYKNLDGTNDNNWNTISDRAKGKLADGTSFGFNLTSGTCNDIMGNTKSLSHMCATVYIDINGNKAPNTKGKDMFAFYITSYGVVPFGTADDSNAPLSSTCKGSSGNGCTAWVLLKENMDYPPAGTGWDGQTTSTP